MQRRTSIEGWVVVLTGASSGNGKTISLALASKGARLVLAARRVRLLEAVARGWKNAAARPWSCRATSRSRSRFTRWPERRWISGEGSTLG